MVFVIVKISAITKPKSIPSVEVYQSIMGGNLPIRLSQITPTSLTIANIARPTHRAGVTYKLSQKNRLSVAVTVRTLGSDDSKTHCESPVEVSTSFHQRRPTSRRPAMFLR